MYILQEALHFLVIFQIIVTVINIYWVLTLCQILF